MTAYNMMRVAERFKSTTVVQLPIDITALYQLAAPRTPDAVVDAILAEARDGTKVDVPLVKERLRTYAHQGRLVSPLPDLTLAEPPEPAPDPDPDPEPVPATQKERAMSTPLLFPVNGHTAPAAKPKPTFNRVNEKIDWAWYSWNPVTGCEHTCVYCYARDIAERHYPEKFTPTFRPERLSAPQHTRQLPEAATQIGARNVFVCSMADLFGKWVPQEWIDAVLAEVRAAPQWNFLFLTKFPQRLAEIDWPGNAWVGTTVDEQYRVKIAEKAFQAVNAPVRWLSCEPLRERLTFTSLEMFDWVVIGGQSASARAPALQPEWEWVEHLHQQARQAGCLVYWKPNLTVRPQEYPQTALRQEVPML